MTALATQKPTRKRIRRRAVLSVTATAVAVNLVVWLVGWAANADFRVTMSGQAVTITPVHVLLTTLVSLAVGLLAVILARRWGPAALRTIAVVGGAVGLLSASTPILAEADAATTVALATMHILTGSIWLVALWRASAPEPAGSR